MEGKGVLKMFKRSIEKRKLKYIQFVGDGDSNTFRIVAEEMKKIYGDRYEVQKEDCIGHMQKRMRNALRTLKKGERLLDNKTIRGKGRLTKEKINSIQLYYGKAIRENRGDLKSMQNAIWAIFYHSLKPKTNIRLDDQHRFCPVCENS